MLAGVCCVLPDNPNPCTDLISAHIKSVSSVACCSDLHSNLTVLLCTDLMLSLVPPLPPFGTELLSCETAC